MCDSRGPDGRVCSLGAHAADVMCKTGKGDDVAFWMREEK